MTAVSLRDGQAGSDAVRLRSGREVAIRPIRPDDGRRLRAAYDLLPEETKYRRFLGPKPHLSDADVRYLAEVDGSDHFALVAADPEHPGRILAVGRFVRSPAERDTAEFAVVVGDPYQREGLATELVERLADAAVARGIVRFTATMLADNTPAHRLVRRLSGRPARERHLGALHEIEADLARAPGNGARRAGNAKPTNARVPAMIAACHGS